MPFSKKTLDFLFENRLHDSREWFHEHNDEYRRFVLEPLKELTIALTPAMLNIDSRFVTEPRVDKTICRIWRDTRYSKDPSLYRDTMWIIFKRDRMHTTEYPGLHFEITPDGFNYGGGFYCASTSFMNRMRAMILEHDPDFERAKKAFKADHRFLMEGDCFKRPRYSDQPEELQQWLERRNISFCADSKDFSLLFSNQLSGYLSEAFETTMAPIYHFLIKVALLEKQEEAAKEQRQRAINW